MAALRSSAIRDLLAVASQPDVIGLAGGLPDPNLVPVERIRNAVDAALGVPAALQYTETTGVARLREVVAARESARCRRPVDASQVVVTHGSQQALSLLAQALVDPGATVVIEEPAYTGVLQVLRSSEARIVTVPLDTDGMRVDVLADLLASGERPVLVHTVSTFHNPRGVTLSADRRRALAELAERYGFLVVEDDPYGELYHTTAPPESVAVQSNRVIRLSSASKTLAPALRVGWLVADPKVCTAVELLKQGADLCGSQLTHLVAADLLADESWFAAHLAGLRAEYGSRAGALREAVDRELAGAAVLGRIDGGMFGWLEFVDDTDTDALLSAALAEGVAFVPGSAFAVDGGQRHSARLCFTTNTPDRLRDAVARLAAAHSR
ncbi:PLP-dependent aminotransferase family protein [Rhodococcus sp. Q]|uniref:aminotransferase-like domain-containing protein n=1 Tax=Rhodococcus sp. Q TaxID=2502252 RepID=UPI0010F58F59|nr:PLP-dependent aminotransferase family protein [Rhodococcus sp. Q]